MSGMTPAGRPLRRDAQRNVERILAAAMEVFGEQGLDASHEVIARRAEVSVGTVYRRFPNRDELIDALFEEQLNVVVGLAEQALAHDDPWEGLVGLLEGTLELAARNVAVRQLVSGSSHGSARIDRLRARLEPLVVAVMLRARDAGALRGDAAPQDMPLLQLMLGSLVDASRNVEPDLWRRYLTLFLDGLRPEGLPRRTLPPPISLDALHHVMAASHGRR